MSQARSRALVAGCAGVLCLVLASAQGYAAGVELPSWSSYEARRLTSLGWLAHSRGDDGAAEGLAARATELDSSCSEAWRLRTLVHADRGSWAEAWAASEQLTVLLPDDLEVALMASRLAVELGERDAAEAALQRAEELDQRELRISLLRALVTARLDRDWAATASLLRSARAQDPSLDLSSLPLQGGWALLVDDPEFLAMLEGVLVAPIETRDTETSRP